MKRTIFLVGIILTIFALSAIRCIPIDKYYRIIIRNETNSPISFYMHYNYPDTMLPNNKPDLWSVKANSETIRDEDYNLYKSVLPNDTLSIFIIHADTLNTYDWSTIKNKYNILHRFDFSEEDMDSKKEDGYIPVIIYP